MAILPEVPQPDRKVILSQYQGMTVLNHLDPLPREGALDCCRAVHFLDLFPGSSIWIHVF